MGFMDKAKQLAEQAQQKLDETQKNFNKSNSPEGQPQGGRVKYDEHGRPIQEAPARRGHGAAGRRAAPHRRARRRAGRTADRGAAGRRRSHAAPRTGERRRERHSRPVQADPVVAERFSRDSMRLGGILTAMVTPFDADGGSTRTPPCGSCTTCWRTAPTDSSSPAAPARARR